MKNKKRFFSKHAKSSAMVVSLAVHALIILVALSFVAVTVIQRDDVNFESRQIMRPKMNLRKLQVPVNVKKPQQQPKLRRQIVVKPKLSTSTPDIKMPEIVGVKGGIGAGGGGLGAGGSLGFSMPEINLFGVKSKGEKVFIILDSSPEMMGDEMGGIPAYTLIKQEVVRVLGELPPTALFNIAVYQKNSFLTYFPQLVSANESNVARVEQWLNPLNAVKRGMGDKEYGLRTLGKGGVKNSEELLAGKIQRDNYWYRPVSLSMKAQADTVFLLTCDWGEQWHDVGERDERWYETAAGRQWLEAYEEGKKQLAEENRKRSAEGRPPRVIDDNPWDINRVYAPNIERPPLPERYHYTPVDFADALLEIRNQLRPVEMQNTLGVKRKTSKSKVVFSLNVIHFRETGQSIRTGYHEKTKANFRQLVNRCNGEYQTLAGLEAIESSAYASSLD